jgi:glycerol kinase
MAYALEGSVFIAGAAVQWLRDGMALLRDAAESERLARSVPDAGGTYLVPAFAGLGAPHWKPDARGIWCGLTRGTTRAHLVRAALESIAYQTRDVVEAMRIESGSRPRSLRVDGGATRNDFLMQFQADVLGVTIERPAMVESTALGAGYLAGIGAGIWSSRDAAPEPPGRVTRFRPRIGAGERMRLVRGWDEAVSLLTRS